MEPEKPKNPKNPEKPEEEKKENESSIQDKITDRFEDLKQSDNMKKMTSFIKSNTKDTVAYIALFVGILLLFFKEFWGGLIIGAVGGFYFADPIIHWIRNFQEYLEKEGLVKVLILFCVALGFLIIGPAFFLGAVAAIGIKFILIGEKKS
ncbi:MAG: hypothetical protein K940chlam3_00518 [Chlamydiae bacterium]|nr:hypothetical protein [Chlamydiota bacterium]